MSEPIYLFVYGTLLLDDTWKYLIGRIPTIIPAKAEGFHRYRVQGEHYPGLWPVHTDEVVQGGCVQLSQEEQNRIDEYEGSEYTREVISVSLENTQTAAFVYLRAPRSEKEWTLHYNAPLIQS